MGDFFDFLEGIAPLASGIWSYFDDKSLAKDYQQAATETGAIDPFGTDNRARYQKLLNQTYANPNRIADLPGYEFARSQGEKAVNRGAAARGGFYSGNVLHELSQFNQGLAGQFYGDEMDRLMQLSGAAFPPNAAAAANLQDRGFNLERNAPGHLLAGAKTSGKDGVGSDLISAGKSLYDLASGGNSVTSGITDFISNLFGGGSSPSTSMATGLLGSGVGALGNVGSLFSGLGAPGVNALTTGALSSGAAGGGFFSGLAPAALESWGAGTAAAAAPASTAAATGAGGLTSGFSSALSSMGPALGMAGVFGLGSMLAGHVPGASRKRRQAREQAWESLDQDVRGSKKVDGMYSYDYNGQNLLLDPMTWEGMRYQGEKRPDGTRYGTGYRVSNMPGYYFGLGENNQWELSKNAFGGINKAPDVSSFEDTQRRAAKKKNRAANREAESMGGTVYKGIDQQSKQGYYWMGGAQGEGDYTPWRQVQARSEMDPMKVQYLEGN